MSALDFFVLDDARAVAAGSSPVFSAGEYVQAVLRIAQRESGAGEDLLQALARLRTTPTEEFALVHAAYHCAYEREYRAGLH